MKTLVVFRDCHAKHNLVWPDASPMDEAFVRRYAAKRGWLVAERKRKGGQQ